MGDGKLVGEGVGGVVCGGAVCVMESLIVLACLTSGIEQVVVWSGWGGGWSVGVFEWK